MKFIKLVFNEKTKKMVFKDEYKTLEKFKETVSGVLGLPTEELVLGLTDLEGETIELLDDFDMEYFLESEENSTNSTVHAFRKALPEPTLDFICLEEEKKIVEGSSFTNEETLLMIGEGQEKKNEKDEAEIKIDFEYVQCFGKIKIDMEKLKNRKTEVFAEDKESSFIEFSQPQQEIKFGENSVFIECDAIE